MKKSTKNEKSETNALKIPQVNVLTLTIVADPVLESDDLQDEISEAFPDFIVSTHLANMTQRDATEAEREQMCWD